MERPRWKKGVSAKDEAGCVAEAAGGCGCVTMLAALLIFFLIATSFSNAHSFFD